MSYARFGEQDSDVYVYFNRHDGYVCCSCGIESASHSFERKRAVDMIRHLEEHRAAGHVVPERAFAGLLRDTENASGHWEESTP